MIYSFIADEAATVIDSGVIITGVCNVSTRQYLAFQREIDIEDDDDWGVYLELNDQGNSNYDIIEHCSLTSENLVIYLLKTIDTKNKFNKIEVTLKIQRAMLEKLTEGLKQVFIDCPNILYINI